MTTLLFRLPHTHTPSRTRSTHTRAPQLIIIDQPTPPLKTMNPAMQEVIGASPDNWDAMFSEAWGSADMVDCILSYAATGGCRCCGFGCVVVRESFGFCESE